MDKKVLNTIIALVVVVGFFAGAVGGGVASFILYRTVQPQHFSQPYAVQFPYRQPSPAWYSNQPAAPSSVEGQLRSKGKHWVRTNGNYTVGAYVQDIYEGRLNQPRGRGAIGKVVSLGSDPNGIPGARVDFGRGYVTGINLSELSLVQVQP